MAQPPSFYGQGPRIARLPTPGNPDAAIAEGVSALGDAAVRALAEKRASENRVADMDEQTRRIEHQREVQRQTSDRARALAESYGQLQVDLINMRAEAGPGAEGHDEKVEERIGRFRDDFMASLGGNPELVDRFADNVATFAAAARVGEVQYAAKARAEKGVTDLETLRATLANGLQTKAAAGELTPEDIANAENLYSTAINAQPLTGNARDEFTSKGKVQFHSSAALGAMERNPQGVIDQVDKGAFDWMPEATRNQLRDRAQSLADKAAREAKSAADDSIKVGRAQARVLIEQVDEGVSVDGDLLKSAHAVAAASQDPEDINLAHDLSVAMARNETTNIYDSVTNDERLAAQREIEAHKGWQEDERLVAAHKQLGVLIERDKREAKADPLGLYVRQTGKAVPAANLADKAAMAGRFTLGDRAGQRYGTPPTHLFEEEAQQLRDQWNTGTPHSRADFIQQLGVYGPQRSRELMRQLAPNKPEYARLVELASFRDPTTKGYVREALDGWAQPPSKAVDSQRMAAEANRMFGDALAKIPGDRRSAILQVANGIYSHRAGQQGLSAFDKDMWAESLNAALGGANGRGGFGKARNGERMVLPGGLTQGEFDTLMGAATAREFADAAGGRGAHWTNGQPLREGELRQLTPVLVSDSGSQALYAFRARGGGYAKRSDGSDFVLDFRALARLIAGRRGR